MNKTKRKIFETSMKLFAEKGYEATSIEEITSVVGVAKGTLYYHFSSKEEIFNYLVLEGMKLLQNSIVIKTSRMDSSVDKLKAIILIQIKILYKYEKFITFLLSQIWGMENRNSVFRGYVFEYIREVEKIFEEGMEKGQIPQGDSRVIASSIFGMICSSMIYKMKSEEEIDINKMYEGFVKYILKGIGV